MVEVVDYLGSVQDLSPAYSNSERVQFGDHHLIMTSFLWTLVPLCVEKIG